MNTSAIAGPPWSLGAAIIGSRGRSIGVARGGPIGSPYHAAMAPTSEEQPEVPTRMADEWLEAVLRSERRGELLTAFDLAERGLVEHP